MGRRKDLPPYQEGKETRQFAKNSNGEWWQRNICKSGTSAWRPAHPQDVEPLLPECKVEAKRIILPVTRMKK